jgi:hypothetical protein
MDHQTWFSDLDSPVHWTDWDLCLLSFPDDLRNQSMWCVLDAHGNRSNFDAVYPLDLFRINFLTLPDHLYHGLQPFDVATASPLIMAFAKHFMVSMLPPIHELGEHESRLARKKSWGSSICNRGILSHSVIERANRLISDAQTRECYCLEIQPQRQDILGQNSNAKIFLSFPFSRSTGDRSNQYRMTEK